MTGRDLYSELGVPRVINAADTMTVLGGGALRPEVLDAMVRAGDRHVDMEVLLHAAGRRIAAMTGNESALITNSAVSAVALAVAGAIAGSSPAAVDAAPNHVTERREVLVMCAQLNPYDRAIRLGGGVPRPVGYSDGTHRWQLESGVTDRTAAIIWYAGTQFENYALSLEDVVGVGDAAGLPVIVDAAAQVPPVDNLRAYAQRGAAAVAFSGGKALGGPQDTAILLGRADTVDTARAHSFPHYGIGRGMKVSKEAVCGLLVALELAMSRDEEAEYARLLEICRKLADDVTTHRGVGATVLSEGVLGQFYPRLRVDVEAEMGFRAVHIVEAFARREPAIRVRVEPTAPESFFLNPFTLSPNEVVELSVALHDVLGEAVRPGR